MAPAKAARIRAVRMKKGALTNEERRQLEERKRLEIKNCWTIDKLWNEYLRQKPDFRGTVQDQCQYEKYQ
ncbi:MAG: hypothetical protein DRG59_08165 [Deltaproteobacteria bacterium]|nr:MAG: hypothetical protein DRG59_08165 [Deltaproteobacteria bacterium]